MERTHQENQNDDINNQDCSNHLAVLVRVPQLHVDLTFIIRHLAYSQILRLERDIHAIHPLRFPGRQQSNICSFLVRMRRYARDDRGPRGQYSLFGTLGGGGAPDGCCRDDGGDDVDALLEFLRCLW